MLVGVVGPGRQGLAFRGAQVDEACVERVQGLVRQRELGLFERRGLLGRETVAAMQGWGHSGGFSVHAGVRVAAQYSAGHDRLLYIAGVDAEPIPELEFDQTMGWYSCAVEMAHAAERGLVWIRRWRGAVSGVGCQFRIVGSVQFPLVTGFKSLLTPNKSGLCPEVNGWWGKLKVVLDESGFSAYRVDVSWGLDFLSVKFAPLALRGTPCESCVRTGTEPTMPSSSGVITPTSISSSHGRRKASRAHCR